MHRHKQFNLHTKVLPILKNSFMIQSGYYIGYVKCNFNGTLNEQCSIKLEEIKRRFVSMTKTINITNINQVQELKTWSFMKCHKMLHL